MLDIEPIGFEVQRDGDDGEKLRVLYSKPNDRFFQLQESLSETSTFIEDQIMKETQIFLVTELNPIFILLPSLLSSKDQQKNRKQSIVDQFESLDQIFLSLAIEQDEDVIEIQNTPCSMDSMNNNW